MAFRTLIISNECYLSIKQLQLQIKQTDNTFTIPLEDILCIVIDNYAVSMSANVLVKCAKYNIIIISCDEYHMPNGIFYSYLAHSRQSLVIDKQLKISQPFKKKLWQQIIKQKIINQAKVLENLEYNKAEIIKKLYALSSNTKSGDTHNHEAQASKIYFNCLFGKEFKRIKKNIKYDISQDVEQLNAALNYTYSILRSLICRYLVAYGLLPTLGIFHDNQLNTFNLADDFIETFRPYIDWYIHEKAFSYETNNLLQYKAELVNIINHTIIIDSKTTSIYNACDTLIKSFISVINLNDITQIKLPHLPNQIQQYNLE